jgi:hypothetical protein
MNNQARISGVPSEFLLAKGAQKKIHCPSLTARGVLEANFSSEPQAVLTWLPINGNGMA